MNDGAYAEFIQHPMFPPFRLENGALFLDALECIPHAQVEGVIRDASKAGELVGLGIEASYRYLARKYVGITRRDVRGAFANMEVHQLHKHVPRAPAALSLVAYQPFTRWEADLTFMNPEDAPQNDGIHVILTCIDVFTKKAWARPLPNKEAVTTRDAFDAIIAEAGTKPRSLQVDNGTEFRGAFEAYLAEREILLILATPYASYAQGAIEKFNQNLKKRLYAYMTLRSTLSWLPHLADAVRAYNATPHSVTRLAPIEAGEANLRRYVRSCLIWGGWKNTRKARALETMLGGPIEVVGTSVRLRVCIENYESFRVWRKLPRHAQKAFTCLFSKKIYHVSEIRPLGPSALYRVSQFRVLDEAGVDPWHEYHFRFDGVAGTYRRWFDRRDLLVVDPAKLDPVFEGSAPLPARTAGDVTNRITETELRELKEDLVGEGLPADRIEEVLDRLRREVPVTQSGFHDVRDEEAAEVRRGTRQRKKAFAPPGMVEYGDLRRTRHPSPPAPAAPAAPPPPETREGRHGRHPVKKNPAYDY